MCVYIIYVYTASPPRTTERPPPAGGNKQPHPAPPHSPRRFRGERHGARRGAPAARARGRSFRRKPIRTTRGGSTGRSWRVVRGGLGACWWAETGVVSGEGGACAARVPEAASGAPKKNGGLFTFCPSSANGRTPSRVPARRRGQLRRCPRWRRRGLVLPGRCSRAQRRRGGRVLPRQVMRAAPGRAPGAAEPGRTLRRRARPRSGCAAKRAPSSPKTVPPRRDWRPGGACGGGERREHPAGRRAGVSRAAHPRRGGYGRAAAALSVSPRCLLSPHPPAPAG